MRLSVLRQGHGAPASPARRAILQPLVPNHNGLRPQEVRRPRARFGSAPQLSSSTGANTPNCMMASRKSFDRDRSAALPAAGAPFLLRQANIGTPFVASVGGSVAPDVPTLSLSGPIVGDGGHRHGKIF